jgi:hypothetical protein
MMGGVRPRSNVPVRRQRSSHGKRERVPAKPEPRVPLQPLLDVLGPFWELAHGRRGVEPGMYSIAPFAERVGVSLRTVARWRKDGVPLTWADRAACSYGVHPSSIWDEWDDLYPQPQTVPL